MKYLVITLLVLVAGVWGYLIGTLEPRVSGSNHEVTQAICRHSANIYSGEWEEACGLAQDITGIQPAATIEHIQPVKEAK